MEPSYRTFEARTALGYLAHRYRSNMLFESCFTFIFVYFIVHKFSFPFQQWKGKFEMYVFENYWKKGALSIYGYVVAEKMTYEHTLPARSCLLASGLLPSTEWKRHSLSSQAPGFQLYFCP